MKWLDETHATNFELVRHFCARMFDSDIFSTAGQGRSVAVSAAAFLLPAGFILLDPRIGEKYYHLSRLVDPEPFRTAANADRLALLALVFAITGLVALLQWQSLFPSQRDYLALAALPVRSRQIFGARFLCVLGSSAAVIVLLNLAPSFLVPLRFSGRWQTNPSFFANVGAWAAASALECSFVFLGIVALHGVLLNLLPARLFMRVSTYVQGALTAALLLTALFSWSLGEWDPKTVSNLWVLCGWAPPVWFLGLHEHMAGSPDAFFTAMSARALGATGAAFAMAGLMYWISYRRYRKLLLESTAGAPQRKRRLDVATLLSRDPRRQAIFDFMAKTVSRSRLHRTVLLSYIGGAAAVLINSALVEAATMNWSGDWKSTARFATVFFPLGASFIVLAGFRHAFSIPAELPANWIFRVTESQGRAAWMSALERFVIVCGIAPIYLLLTPLAVVVFGWAIAIRMTVMQVIVSLAAFDFLFYSWQQLPFTCSYVPGKKPLVGILANWLTVLGLIVPLLSVIIGATSRLLPTFLVYLIPFVGVWLWARRARRDGWGESRIVYEDIPRVVETLGLTS